MVLTHTNTYKKITKVMISKTNKIYKLSTMCSEDLFATEGQLFYVRHKYREWDNLKRRAVRKFKSPKWIKLKDLTKDYYVGVAINEEAKLPKWRGIEVNSSYAKKRE